MEAVFGVHVASTLLTVVAAETGRESQDEDEGNLRAGAEGVAASENGQLISLNRASAV